MKHINAHHECRAEIHVPESDIKNLIIFHRSDIVFAVFYGTLFIWGLVLTYLSI